MRMHVGFGTTVDAVTMFPVWTDSPDPGGDYLPFVAADADDRLIVSESEVPSVPTLVATNRTDLPVLLLAGEVVSGGRQDRVLNATVLVEAHTQLQIPVSCVEAGRWGGGPRTRRAGHAPSTLRARTTASTAQRTDRSSDQGEVWREVAAHLARHGTQSPTFALRAVSEVDNVARRFPLLEGQRGVIVGIGRQVRSLELFDRHETLYQCFASLVSAALADGVGVPAGVTSAGAARRFARSVATAPSVRRPAVGLGSETTLSGRSLVGTSLRWRGRVVHLAAFGQAVS